MSRTYFIPLSSRSILYLDPSHPFIPLPSLLPHPIPTSFLPFYFPTFLTLFLPFTSYLSHFFISPVLPLYPPHPLSSISSTPSPIILESINPLSYFTPSFTFLLSSHSSLLSSPSARLFPSLLLYSCLHHSLILFPPPFHSHLHSIPLFVLTSLLPIYFPHSLLSLYNSPPTP